MTGVARGYALSLGSNASEPRAWLDLAVRRIGELDGVSDLARSGDWESAAVGGPSGQPSFVNTAVTINASLRAEELLPALLAIETELGRVRNVRWGPRPIDIDLILVGPRALDGRTDPSQVVASPWLVVPHPRWAVRQFVLQPLSELIPSWIDPITGKTVAEVRDRWRRRPQVFAFAGFPVDQVADWVAQVVVQLPHLARSDPRTDATSDLRPVLDVAASADRVPHAVFVPPDWYPHAPVSEFPRRWSSAVRVPLEFDPIHEIAAAVEAADPLTVRRLNPAD